MRKGTHSAIQEPINGLDTGWSWVVMLACFASSFVVGETNYTTGIMHVTLLDMHLGNQATTSLFGALHSSLTCLAAPLCSMVIDKFSLRTAFITSGVLYTIGFLATAFSPSIGVSIVTCGIISGFGAAFGVTSSLVAIGFYFRRYAILYKGLDGIGGSVGPVLGGIILDRVGTYGQVFVIAGIAIVIAAVFGMLSLLLDRCCPSDEKTVVNKE